MPAANIEADAGWCKDQLRKEWQKAPSVLVHEFEENGILQEVGDGCYSVRANTAMPNIKILLKNYGGAFVTNWTKDVQTEQGRMENMQVVQEVYRKNGKDSVPFGQPAINKNPDSSAFWFNDSRARLRFDLPGDYELRYELRPFRTEIVPLVRSGDNPAPQKLGSDASGRLVLLLKVKVQPSLPAQFVVEAPPSISLGSTQALQVRFVSADKKDISLDDSTRKEQMHLLQSLMTLQKIMSDQPQDAKELKLVEKVDDVFFARSPDSDVGVDGLQLKLLEDRTKLGFKLEFTVLPPPPPESFKAKHPGLDALALEDKWRAGFWEGEQQTKARDVTLRLNLLGAIVKQAHDAAAGSKERRTKMLDTGATSKESSKEKRTAFFEYDAGGVLRFGSQERKQMKSSGQSPPLGQLRADALPDTEEHHLFLGGRNYSQTVKFKLTSGGTPTMTLEPADWAQVDERRCVEIAKENHTVLPALVVRMRDSYGAAVTGDSGDTVALVGLGEDKTSSIANDGTATFKDVKLELAREAFAGEGGSAGGPKAIKVKFEVRGPSELKNKLPPLELFVGVRPSPRATGLQLLRNGVALTPEDGGANLYELRLPAGSSVQLSVRAVSEIGTLELPFAPETTLRRVAPAHCPACVQRPVAPRILPCPLARSFALLAPQAPTGSTQSSSRTRAQPRRQVSRRPRRSGHLRRVGRAA